MKEKFSDSLKSIYDNGLQWVKLEIEYAKLTAAEKITVLLTTLIFGAVCMLLGMVILILLAFSLVDVLQTFLSPALAFLCGAGILVVLILILFLLRRPLLENPISRLISKLILDVKPRDNHEQK
ncbi:MAG: phage holin family protein [Muribaculaceae bacterium]|nr:phage holin family protein [Muribaculaceae bacterium]MDE5923684.1 phage holin family protein [Muribaculaceae bacterium]